MNTNEIVKFARQQLKNGVSVEEIKSGLTTSGLNSIEVDKVLYQVTMLKSSAVCTWIFAILSNIGVYLFLYNNFLNTDHYGRISFLELHGARMILFGTLLLSTIPTFLSGVYSKNITRTAYGIPLVLIAIGVLIAFTVGGFAILGYLPVAICALVFIIFLGLGSFFRRSRVQIVISFLIIEIIVFTIVGISLMQKSEEVRLINEKLSFLSKLNSNSIDPAEAVQICDSIPVNPENVRSTECWQKVITLFPNMDICSLSQHNDSKSDCLWRAELQYEFICENKDREVSFSKKDDPVENQRLANCWMGGTRMNPPIDVCYNTHEWNKEKCRTVIDNISTDVDNRSNYR